MGSDLRSDFNPTVLSDVETQIRQVAQTITRPPFNNNSNNALYQKAHIRPSVDDLEAVVDTKEQVKAEAAWDDPAELKVQSFIHRAWALEINRQGWSIGEITSDHIKALRMAQAAIRLIPKREPIA